MSNKKLFSLAPARQSRIMSVKIARPGATRNEKKQLLGNYLHRLSPSLHQNTSPKWLTPSFFNMHSWRHPGRAKMLCMLSKMIHMYTTIVLYRCVPNYCFKKWDLSGKYCGGLNLIYKMVSVRKVLKSSKN